MNIMKVILGISLCLTLSAMEEAPTVNPALKKEIINYLRNQIITKNGKQNNILLTTVNPFRIAII